MLTEKIKVILNQAEKIEEFDGRVIIFLSEEPFKALWKIREEEINHFLEEGHNGYYARKKALQNYFKILNPTLTPVKVVSFGYKRIYSIVRDKEKILENYIKKDFYMWANHIRKEAKKFIKEFVSDEMEAKRVLDEAEEKIKEKENLLEDILQNPDNYELLRTDLEFRKDIYQPVINARIVDLKTKTPERRPVNLYLRENVPNVIWEYKEPILKKKRPSPILDGIKDYENVFGRIYIKRKDD